MVHEGRSPLAGRIETDEMIVEGSVRGKSRRGVTKAEQSTLVFGAVKDIACQDKRGEDLKKTGRILLAVSERADAVSIGSFFTRKALPGSVINTDGWKGYPKNALAGYRHEPPDPETHALQYSSRFRQSPDLAQWHPQRSSQIAAT